MDFDKMHNIGSIFRLIPSNASKDENLMDESDEIVVPILIVTYVIIIITIQLPT